MPNLIMSLVLSLTAICLIHLAKNATLKYRGLEIPRDAMASWLVDICLVSFIVMLMNLWFVSRGEFR